MRCMNTRSITLHGLPALAYKSEMKVNRSPAFKNGIYPTFTAPPDRERLTQATAIAGLAAQAATSTGIDVSPLRIH